MQGPDDSCPIELLLFLLDHFSSILQLMVCSGFFFSFSFFSCETSPPEYPGGLPIAIPHERTNNLHCEKEGLRRIHWETIFASHTCNTLSYIQRPLNRPSQSLTFLRASYYPSINLPHSLPHEQCGEARNNFLFPKIKKDRSEARWSYNGKWAWVTALEALCSGSRVSSNTKSK